MATVPATPTLMRPRREMIEAKAPEMMKFSRQGQELTGVLINIEPVTVRGESQTLEYTLLDDNGERLTFLGTNDLNKKIQARYIGHYLGIRYESDDNSFTKQGQSAAKVFRVLVSKDKEPGY